jgi:uncharacterized protein YndB with AHSA1/START domain
MTETTETRRTRDMTRTSDTTRTIDTSRTADLHHRIGIVSPSTESVYAALTTVDGLAGWWTTDTTGDPSLGGTIAFRFVPGGFDMEVSELIPGERVRWRVVDGPPEWFDTTVEWQLSRTDGMTIVRFAHEGWTDVGAFMAHCNTKWAVYLMSLKALVETGVGSPSPHDVMISDWH